MTIISAMCLKNLTIDLCMRVPKNLTIGLKLTINLKSDNLTQSKKYVQLYNAKNVEKNK